MPTLRTFQTYPAVLAMLPWNAVKVSCSNVAKSPRIALLHSVALCLRSYAYCRPNGIGVE